MKHFTITINGFFETFCVGFISSVMMSGCVTPIVEEVASQETQTQAQTQARPVLASALSGDGQNSAGDGDVETITIKVASEKEAILNIVDNFFEALATNDADAIERLVSADATEVTVYPEDDGRPPRYGRARDISGAMRAGQLPKIEEPYWNPIVLQRKGLAVVWAPYEVWVNERLAHCGIDIFTLSYQKTNWVINSIQWTQEPSACEELWPEGRSVLRPNFFNNSSQ